MKLERPGLLSIITISTLVCLAVATAVVGLSYRSVIDDTYLRLQDAARSQVRLIEAFTRHELSTDLVFQIATDRQLELQSQSIAWITDAHQGFDGFGETGEFAVARRDGDRIVFLLQQRLARPGQSDPISIDGDLPEPRAPSTLAINSDLAEPMRRALAGESGIILAPDYRGEMVYAAYEPVALVQLGLVAKIDKAEVIEDISRLAFAAVCIALLAAGAATFLALRLTQPTVNLIRRQNEAIEDSNRLFEHLFDHAEVSIWNEDFSAVYGELQKLRQIGVKDLRRYLTENRAVPTELAALIRVTFVNESTLRLFGANEEKDILSRVDRTVGPDAINVFINELCAIWDGERVFRSEATLETLDGREFEAIVSFRIPENKNELVSVPVSIMDITEQKKIQNALQDSEARWRSLTDNSSDHIMLIDRDMKIQFINRTVPDLQNGSVLGTSIIEFTPEDYRELVYGQYQKILQTGVTSKYRTMYVTKDGMEHYFDVRLSALEKDGRVEAVISSSNDVTVAAIEENALRNLASGLSAITGHEFYDQVARHLCESLGVEHAYIGELNKDSDKIAVRGGYQFGKPVVLPQEHELSGTSSEGLTGGRYCVYASGVTDLFPRDRMLVESGAESYAGIGLTGKAGRPLGVMAIFSNKPFENAGAIETLIRIFSDTVAAEIEREQVQTKLRRFEHIVSNTTDMLVLFDQRCAHLAANGVYLAAVDKNWDELIDRTPSEVIDKKYIPAGFVRNANRCMAGENICLLGWFEFATGGRKFWEATYTPCLAEDEKTGQGFIVTARDITEREQLQQQLAQAQKMESVGRLAGGVAHDFNNMLGVILGCTELALERTHSDQALRSDLMDIQNAAERSAELTRQLLAFARKQAIAPKVLDLNETIEGMVNMLRRLIGEDIELQWQPKESVWPVRMDPSQIDQILANLCVNTRDAITDVGIVSIETENVSFSTSYCAAHAGFEVGDYVRLAISDNGSGIDEEAMANLFDPFFTTKEVGKGTGLGLATVWGAVKQSNGFMNVNSKVGQGATFEIYLPRCEVEATSRQQPATQKRVTGDGSTILVVEDEKAILKLSKTMLERHGYKVLTAANPIEASALAEAHSGEIDLLLTDVIMPDMNGKDLAENMKSIYPDLKQVFMSGYTADIISDRGVLPDDTQFVQKPFTKNELISKIEVVLAQT